MSKTTSHFPPKINGVLSEWWIHECCIRLYMDHVLPLVVNASFVAGFFPKLVPAPGRLLTFHCCRLSLARQADATEENSRVSPNSPTIHTHMHRVHQAEQLGKPSGLRVYPNASVIPNDPGRGWLRRCRSMG